MDPNGKFMALGFPHQLTTANELRMTIHRARENTHLRRQHDGSLSTTTKDCQSNFSAMKGLM